MAAAATMALLGSDRSEGVKVSAEAAPLWLHLQGDASCFLSAKKRRRHLCQVKRCFPPKRTLIWKEIKKYSLQMSSRVPGNGDSLSSVFTLDSCKRLHNCVIMFVS